MYRDGHGHGRRHAEEKRHDEQAQTGAEAHCEARAEEGNQEEVTLHISRPVVGR